MNCPGCGALDDHGCRPNCPTLQDDRRNDEAAQVARQPEVVALLVGAVANLDRKLERVIRMLERRDD